MKNNVHTTLRHPCQTPPFFFGTSFNFIIFPRIMINKQTPPPYFQWKWWSRNHTAFAATEKKQEKTRKKKQNKTSRRNSNNNSEVYRERTQIAKSIQPNNHRTKAHRLITVRQHIFLFVVSRRRKAGSEEKERVRFLQGKARARGA